MIYFSAKVSSALVLTLPKNSAVLYGNGSKDDHGITKSDTFFISKKFISIIF
jgi:hypothetical protein